MTWQIVEDTAGAFTIRRDGVDVGTLSLLPTVPGTGEALYPSVRAGVVAAALNDFDTTVRLDGDMRYRAKGWPSADAYHAEIEVCQIVVADLPANVKRQITAAWKRHGWTLPITPEQMIEWQATIDRLATTHPEAAA